MKTIIETKKAPATIAAYSQGLIINNTLFISGQVAFDPVSGDLVLDDIKTETKRVMENLKAILVEAGMTFENVAKASIFITDMNEFSKVDEIYGSYFRDGMYPARETVAVAGLPKSVNVEISMIAFKN